MYVCMYIMKLILKLVIQTNFGLSIIKKITQLLDLFGFKKPFLYCMFECIYSKSTFNFNWYFVPYLGGHVRDGLLPIESFT